MKTIIGSFSLTLVWFLFLFSAPRGSDAFLTAAVGNPSLRILLRHGLGIPQEASTSPLVGSSSSALYLNNISGWFGRRKKRQDKNDSENLGGVASIVDSMGDLKTAQRVGQLTDSLVKDLATTVVEGSALDGKVKVSFDCQQKPRGVTIDEAFLSETDATTLSNALTTAMKDAHTKSIERMDEKMKYLYAELGLSQSAAS